MLNSFSSKLKSFIFNNTEDNSTGVSYRRNRKRTHEERWVFWKRFIQFQS